MKQRDFIKALQLQCGLPNIICTILNEKLCNEIMETLRTGDFVEVPRLGKFYTSIFNGKEIWNQKTGTFVYRASRAIVKLNRYTVYSRQTYPDWRPWREGRGSYPYTATTIGVKLFAATGYDFITCQKFVYQWANAIIVLGDSELSIPIRNFGTFYLKHKQIHYYANPRTGSPATMPARDIWQFRPSKNLKDYIN